MSHYPTQERESKYEPLQIQPEVVKITYQNAPQLIIRVVVLCFSTFYFGYCLTYFSTFQDPLNAQVLDLQKSQTTFYSLLIGIVPIGAIIGAGLAPLLMRFFTRKQFILTINACAIVVEAILQVTNVYAFLVCRLFQGVFIGNYMAIVPIYINQLAPKQIVGSLGVFTQLFVIVGFVLSYGLGLIFQTVNLSYDDFYRLMVGLNGIFIIVQSTLLITGYIPQSPNSLIAKGKQQQAKKVIALFTLPQYVQKVLQQKNFQVDIELGKSSTQQEQLKYPAIAYILGFQLPFMQQLTGTNAIITSASTIVGQILPSLSNDVPIIINAVQIFATMATVIVLTRVGRKPLTLWGNLALAVIDILLGLLFVFDKWAPSGMIVFVLLMVYMIVYGISLGPVVWLYVPEIIPAKIVPFATMMNWFGCSLCVMFTPIAIAANHKNPAPVFFFFGAITFLFYIFNLFFMVETKGKSKKEVIAEFKGLKK